MSLLRSLLSAITWNESYEDEPASSDSPSEGDDKIRELREAIRERFAKEHKMNLASGTVGPDGYHKNGATLPYFQASEPTTRPDGVTALDENDNGRRWIKSTNYSQYTYVHGTGWVETTTPQSGTVNIMSGDNEINVTKLTGLRYGDVGTYVIAGSTDWAADNEYLPGGSYNGNTLVRGSEAIRSVSLNADQGYLAIKIASEVNLGLAGTWQLLTRVYNYGAASSRPTGLFMRTA